MVNANTKRCYKCGETKGFSEFHKNKAQKSGYAGACKECSNESSIAKNRTKEGLIVRIHGNQRWGSRRRNRAQPNYTLSELRIWALAQPIFHDLHSAWVKSDYSKALTPSFDRLNDYLPYSLDNLQIITWQQNKDKSNYDRKNGINNKVSIAIVQMTKDGLCIAEHYSIMQAERTTKIGSRNIAFCLSGERKSAGGFRWMKSLGIPIHNNLPRLVMGNI